MIRSDAGPSRTALVSAWGIGVVVGVVVGVLTKDVILGFIAGAPTVVLGVQLLRLWYGGTARPRHP